MSDKGKEVAGAVAVADTAGIAGGVGQPKEGVGTIASKGFGFRKGSREVGAELARQKSTSYVGTGVGVVAVAEHGQKTLRKLRSRAGGHNCTCYRCTAAPRTCSVENWQAQPWMHCDRHRMDWHPVRGKQLSKVPLNLLAGHCLRNLPRHCSRLRLDRDCLEEHLRMMSHMCPSSGRYCARHRRTPRLGAERRSVMPVDEHRARAAGCCETGFAAAKNLQTGGLLRDRQEEVQRGHT